MQSQCQNQSPNNNNNNYRQTHNIQSINLVLYLIVLYIFWAIYGILESWALPGLFLYSNANTLKMVNVNVALDVFGTSHPFSSWSSIHVISPMKFSHLIDWLGNNATFNTCGCGIHDITINRNNVFFVCCFLCFIRSNEKKKPWVGLQSAHMNCIHFDHYGTRLYNINLPFCYPFG